MKTCPVCKKTHSKNKNPFTADSLKSHVHNAHPKDYIRLYYDEYNDPILNLADVIAGDESDGVFWGIAHELGYFG